jgi:hypothetical protein
MWPSQLQPSRLTQIPQGASFQQVGLKVHKCWTMALVAYRNESAHAFEVAADLDQRCPSAALHAIHLPSQFEPFLFMFGGDRPLPALWTRAGVLRPSKEWLSRLPAMKLFLDLL